ncbi:MAG: dienelactone hydrolase [Pirellulales bacterium]
MRHLIGIATLCAVGSVGAAEYDPLAVKPGVEPPSAVDLDVVDSRRERTIPIRVYAPAKTETSSRPPVVVFSHGLGGSREGSNFLGQHWASRGYFVVYVQHPGSDEGVWKDIPFAKRLGAMKEAASAKNLELRLGDVPVVLNQLNTWSRDSTHAFHGQLDAESVGMSGHSFGAQTTQGLSGQQLPIVGQKFLDSRIKAAVVMSPGAPLIGSTERAFGDVKIPWLVMTGTHDGSPIGGQTVETRRQVFPALPQGDKFELVLDKAEHSVFTERPLPGERMKRNPNHRKVIIALTTAFWDAYLTRNEAAKSWLTSPAARSVMEPDDQWQAR